MLDITVTFDGAAELIDRLAALSTAAQVFGSSSATVRSDDPVARYVEEGTRPHDIYPRDKQALFWEGAPHPFSHVHHPGTTANTYMERGRDKAMPEIEQLVASSFEQVATGGGSNYTKIMDDAGKLLLEAVRQEAPPRPSSSTAQGPTLRESLYYVNGSQ